MPVYVYKCGCGKVIEESRPVATRDIPAVCPSCRGVAERDMVAGMTAHADQGYSSPILSDALGVHPDQIADAKRRFPHHNFAPDGRMILSSHTERKRVMRELGYFDKDAYA